MITLADIAIPPSSSLRDALHVIDKAGVQTCLIVKENGVLLGLVTDGDVRRALLGGAGMDASILQWMNPAPTCAHAGDSREDILAVLNSRRIRLMPVVDDHKRVTSVAVLDDFMIPVTRDNWVVLHAGGLGTRLRPITEHVPKPLIDVGGRPILETILRNFAREGFRQVYISINYLGEKIKDYFGDGSRWNVEIRYLEENQRLGTAGSLGLLPKRPELPIISMNGDLLTDLSMGGLVDYHVAHAAAVTVAVCDYSMQVPYGVVRLDGHKVQAIEEKPIQKFFINAGIYVYDPSVLDLVLPGYTLDAPELIQRVMAQKKNVAAFPMREMWLDIGRHDDLERARLNLELLNN